MAGHVRSLNYYHTTVADQPGEGHRLLTQLAEQRINLLAFHAVPSGSGRTQLTIFPEEEPAFVACSKRAGLDISGPHCAIMVQGDDELGVLARVHRVLHDANVNVYASVGLATGKGSYGCVLYVRDDEADRAAQSLAAAEGLD